MSRTNKLTAAAGAAACAVCCAPLVLGPLAALGGVIAAGMGTAGLLGASSADAPRWLLIILALVALSASIGVAYGIAALARGATQRSRVTLLHFQARPTDRQ